MKLALICNAYISVGKNWLARIDQVVKVRKIILLRSIIFLHAINRHCDNLSELDGFSM